MRPSCPVWILRIVHTIVIQLDLPCPKATREKPHLKRVKDPLQQSPHPQSMSCLRTPPTPSMSKSSLSPSPPSHLYPHLCPWIPNQLPSSHTRFSYKTPHPTPL